MSSLNLLYITTNSMSIYVFTLCGINATIFLVCCMIKFRNEEYGKYMVRIIGANASGNFNINISSTNDIKISHINFYN